MARLSAAAALVLMGLGLLYLYNCDNPNHTEWEALGAVRNQRTSRGRTLDQVLTALDDTLASKNIKLESRTWSATVVKGSNWTVYMKEAVQNPHIGRRVENEYVWNVDLKAGTVQPINALARATVELLKSDRSGD